MNPNVNNAINGAKKIIKKRYENYFADPTANYSKYSKIYKWTNENINAYLSLFPLEDKEKALSVLASGDQAFNLVCKGIRCIDTFDTNALTEYYSLGIKRAMILKYTYKEFLLYMSKLCSNNNLGDEDVYSIIRGLYPYMEKNHQIFWEALINFDYKFRKDNGNWYNLIELLAMNEFDNRFKYLNTYLMNEENYNILRNNLRKANITFKYANAKELNDKFRGNKYDLILLSNILDYFAFIFCDSWGYHNLLEYEQKLERICNKKAIIFLKYVFYYKSEDDITYPKTSQNIFRDSYFLLSDMQGEEIIPIRNNDHNKAEDAIILKRV